MKRSLVFIILLGLLTMMTTHALGEIGEAEFKAKLSKQRARMRPDGEYHHGKVKYVYQEGTSAEMTENLEVSDRSIRELHKVQVVKGPVNLSDLGDLEIDQTNQFQRLENVLIIEGPVTSPQELNLGTIDVGKQSHL